MQVYCHSKHGDPFVEGVKEIRILDGGAHALAGFLHGSVGQPDDGEADLTVGDVDFHVDGRAIQSDNRAATDLGEHASLRDARVVRPVLAENLHPWKDPSARLPDERFWQR